MSEKSMPGVINIKDEAARQKEAEQARHTKAALVMQKWARGWKDRKRTSKLRNRMRNEIESDHAHYTAYFKMNDEFNLNKFIEKKKAIRSQIGTDVIEESISEKIGDSID